jgi:hypothetical protein
LRVLRVTNVSWWAKAMPAVSVSMLPMGVPWHSSCTRARAAFVQGVHAKALLYSCQFVELGRWVLGLVRAGQQFPEHWCAKVNVSVLLLRHVQAHGTQVLEKINQDVGVQQVGHGKAHQRSRGRSGTSLWRKLLESGKSSSPGLVMASISAKRRASLLSFAVSLRLRTGQTIG